MAAILTLDGPSGSGKGTLSALVARQLGWHLLDSGALYRLLALAALDRGMDLADESALVGLGAALDVVFEPACEARAGRILLDGREATERIRTETMGAAASQVAALPGVRAALLDRQRAFARPPGLVADGRDMGTVVFPEAALKIFLTASAEERGRRRYEQLKAAGENVNLGDLVEQIRKRDAQDTQRPIAPLRPAPDALVLDSTQLSIQAVLEKILGEARARGLTD